MSFRRILLALVVIAGASLPVARADEPVLLKYKFSPGDTAWYKTSQDMKSAQTINGTKIETTTKMETVYTRTVDEVSDKGRTTFKLKADSRKVSGDFSPVGKYEFDSKAKERDTSSQIGALLTPLLERLTGSEYQVVVDSLGHVTQVKGHAELIAHLVKDNPLAMQFGGGDNTSALLAEQDVFLMLSDKPVKPGDVWQIPFDIELPNLGRTRGTVTCTYEGPDQVNGRKTARVGMSANLSFDLNLDQGGAKVTGMISSTTATATVQFDPEAGRIVSVKRALALSGTLSVDAGGMIIPVESQQEQSTTIEFLDKKPE